MEDLKELLIEELKDLYSAEKQIVKALPKIIKGADSDDLKNAISEHLEVTKTQVERLDEIFAALGEKPKAKHCKGMEGLLEEGAECLEEEPAGPLRDLQLIGAAQRVEHYEMAAYGTARAIAEAIGATDVIELLTKTFSEEEEADQKLTEVAEALYEAVENSGEEVDVDMEDEDAEPKAAQPQKRAAKARAS